jgi:hypothetical protein
MLCQQPAKDVAAIPVCNIYAMTLPLKILTA